MNSEFLNKMNFAQKSNFSDEKKGKQMLAKNSTCPQVNKTENNTTKKRRSLDQIRYFRHLQRATQETFFNQPAS